MVYKGEEDSGASEGMQVRDEGPRQRRYRGAKKERQPVRTLWCLQRTGVRKKEKSRMVPNF